MGRLLASLSRSFSFNSKPPAATLRQTPNIKEEEEEEEEVVVVVKEAGRLISGPLAKLEADLAHRLRHLTLEGGINALNLTWLSDAMAVALSTQSSSRAAIEAALLPIRSNPSLAHHITMPPHEHKLLLQHLHTLACLMDDCNSLRQATFRMSEHLARLDHALHGLVEAAGTATSSSKVTRLHKRLLQAAEWRLSACMRSTTTTTIMEEPRSSRLYRSMMKKVKALSPPPPPSSSSSASTHPPHSLEPVIQAMHGVTLTTTLILCAAVSSFLTPPATRKNSSAARLRRSASNLYASAVHSSSDANTAVTSASSVSWAAPFRQLHKQLLQSSGCGGGGGGGAAELASGFLTGELAALHAAAGALIAGPRKEGNNGVGVGRIVGMGAARVGKAARDLRGSVAMLHKQACELALGLAEVRVALLEACGCAASAGGALY